MRALYCLIPISLFAAAGAYETSLEQWRQRYEASLRAEDGWLSVAALGWLHEGDNRIGSDSESAVVLPPSAPKNAGIVSLHEGQASFTAAAGVKILINGGLASHANLAPDTAPVPDRIQIGDLHAMLIQRGARYGLRVRDPHALTRVHFTGLHWFPPNEQYRVKARFVVYDPPRKIPITNVLGDTENQECPGYAEFQLHGRIYRLEPVMESPTELFFMFRDETSRTETYASGRFLTTPLAQNGELVIDFNHARNPPCAFTQFATCPIPPKQNRMLSRVEAGEKRYGRH